VLFQLAFLVLCGQNPAGSPPIDTPAQLVPIGDEQPDSVEVLAVSVERGWAAVRITSHVVRSEECEACDAPYNCHYPGMQKKPTSGVRLVLWSLNKRREEAKFVIYAVAGNQKQCSTATQSAKQLDAAKASFKAHGLDVSKPPSSTLASVQVTTLQSRFDENDLETDITDSTTFAEGNGITEFSVGGQVIYRLKVERSVIHDTWPRLQAPAAFTEGGRIVFFLSYRVASQLVSSDDAYGFSPVLTLPSTKGVAEPPR
jgi:hypothetical protein